MFGVFFSMCVHVLPMPLNFTICIILQNCMPDLTMLQVQIGTHSFTFDHVYGSTGYPSSAMFEECIAPLVDGLFQGYNATVLAYGQVT